MLPFLFSGDNFRYSDSLIQLSSSTLPECSSLSTSLFPLFSCLVYTDGKWKPRPRKTKNLKSDFLCLNFSVHQLRIWVHHSRLGKVVFQSSTQAPMRTIRLWTWTWNCSLHRAQIQRKKLLVAVDIANGVEKGLPPFPQERTVYARRDGRLSMLSPGNFQS